MFGNFVTVLPNTTYMPSAMINGLVAKLRSTKLDFEMSSKHVMANKQWPHSPEALLRGRLVYNVKFYGDQEVQQAKGTEPIKEAVRKMKFHKQLRKAEGHKVTPKVELCINVDGISIQDPKTKIQQYKFPLHHISYCADDKSEKKLFTFIAKDGTTGKHHCFVLGSEKSAEEITLTIGQAFDLAYKRFLEKKETQMEKDKQLTDLQHQVKKLQEENMSLKKRVAELEAEKNNSSAFANSLTPNVTVPSSNGPAVGTRLEGLIFTDDFEPRHSQPSSHMSTTNGTQSNGDIYATVQPKLAPPPSSKSSHRTGPQSNLTPPQPNPFQPALPSVNFDMEHGFKGGLVIGIEDFDLSSLDPLK
ncbi:ced-6 [Bugula neritina]|uniref:Ced-6 n=1 Tax=Bugula neritina TaxID=10212 RepID=A0A7J7KHJ1_BUGNE|nr:ced-6 [Bugula neritina]